MGVSAVLGGAFAAAATSFSGPKAVENQVGIFKDLNVAETGLERHHVPQFAALEEVVKKYFPGSVGKITREETPAIALLRDAHWDLAANNLTRDEALQLAASLVKQRVNPVRGLLAKGVAELRSTVEREKLQEIISLMREKFPTVLKRWKRPRP